MIAFTPSPQPDAASAPGTSTVQDFAAAVLLTAFFVAFALSWPFFRWFTSGALIAGCLFAVTAHRWYRLYSSEWGADSGTVSRPPEINLASIAVGSNAGGLIFVVGSVVIVLVGLPELAWFFALAIGGGIAFAVLMLKWRSLHPFRTVPANTLVSRG